jgi:hypothetical protein
MHELGGLASVEGLIARSVRRGSELESSVTRELDGERVYSDGDLVR